MIFNHLRYRKIEADGTSYRSNSIAREDALNRLRGTTINTNLMTGGKADKRGFGMIDKWRILERSDTDDRMTAVEITLSDWLYRAARGLEMLTTSGCEAASNAEYMS